MRETGGEREKEERERHKEGREGERKEIKEGGRQEEFREKKSTRFPESSAGVLYFLPFHSTANKSMRSLWIVDKIYN